MEDRGAFRAASQQLKEMDKSLARELAFVLRKQAQPIVAAQRNAARGIPVTGVSGSTGLRRKVGGGVRVKVRAVRRPDMRIVTTMRDSKLAFAPRGLDTEFSGWRAPLFGDHRRWYQHRMSGPSWFMGPAAQAQPKLRAEIVKTLNSTAEEIARKASALRGN